VSAAKRPADGVVQVAILGRPHTARILDRAPFDPDGARLRDRALAEMSP